MECIDRISGARCVEMVRNPRELVRFGILVSVLMVLMAFSVSAADDQFTPRCERRAVSSAIGDAEACNEISMLSGEHGWGRDGTGGLTESAEGEEICFYPLTAAAFSENSPLQGLQFLTYINHQILGRGLLFAELSKSENVPWPELTIIFPDGRSIILKTVSFGIYQTNPSSREIELSENTIRVSDTCDVLRIISIVLAGACLISTESVVCIIAAVMEAVYQIAC